MVVELDSMAYDKIRQMVKEKVKHIENSFIELAKLLTFIKERALYKRWRYETFSDYVEMDLSLPKHKAQYFISLCSAMKKLPLTDQDIKELGLEKVKHIVSLSGKVDDKQFIAIKQQAKQDTVRIVEQRIKKLKNTLPKLDVNSQQIINELLTTEDEVIVKCAMNLFESVYDLFEATIEKAQKICETDSKNMAIDYICQVFNATVTKEGKEEDLILLIKQLERTFKVKIIIKKGDKVIYGEE